MSEIPNVSNELTTRYKTSYAFAEKVIRGGSVLWYVGLGATLLQTIVMGIAGLGVLQEIEREVRGGESFSIRGQTFYALVIYGTGIAVTIAWFYAGSLVLAAFGNSLKMQVDAAVNSSRDLSEDARTTLLLDWSRPDGRS